VEKVPKISIDNIKGLSRRRVKLKHFKQVVVMQENDALFFLQPFPAPLGNCAMTRGVPRYQESEKPLGRSPKILRDRINLNLPDRIAIILELSNHETGTSRFWRGSSRLPVLPKLTGRN
jgi:hypothetical protein